MQVSVCQSVHRDSVCRGLDRSRHESHSSTNLPTRCVNGTGFAVLSYQRTRPVASQTGLQGWWLLGWRLLGAAALDNVWLRCSG